MGRRAVDSLPEMRHYKPRNQARIRLSGQDVYLGEWRSEEARARYDQVVRMWLANGRRWPPPRSSCATLADVGDLYIRWARAHYVKRGRPTKTALTAKRALDLLYRAPAPSATRRGLGQLAPTDFGPKALKAFQAYLAGDTQGPGGSSRWSRETINEYTRHIVAMFKWAVSEELVPAEIYEALRTVAPIRRGRPPAVGLAAPREGRPVDPVPAAYITAARKHLGPVVNAMIDLQLLTAMRPGEVCHIRAGDLAPTVRKGVVCYHVPPEANKLDHKEIDRAVFIGPRGMEVLRPWIPADPDAFVFTPRESEGRRRERLRAERKTPAWPSHSTEARRRRRGQSVQRLSDHYSEDAYARAIARACAQAGIPTWSPNRLRHNAATIIAEREDLEVAQLVLGHRDIRTTLRYVKVKDRRAMVAALRHG